MISEQLHRVALVTGAARGIGRKIALRLATDGHDVALSDLPGTGLPSVMQEVKSLGRRSHMIYANVGEENQVKSMIEKTASNLGRLDIVSMIITDGSCFEL
jgi:meso-butanediol dehydrogenase / (S,S)-butanediol dehydrogenase / diacetyl reductase